MAADKGNSKAAPRLGAALLHVAHRLAALGTVLSSIALAGIVVIYCYEVVARYVFDAPTRWASDFVTYLLCWSIFLAVPAISERKAHVSVTILTDRPNFALGGKLARIGVALTFATCVATAYIVSLETIRQFERNITTLAAIQVPKWMISLPITYGFLLSAVFFLAHLLEVRQVKHNT